MNEEREGNSNARRGSEVVVAVRFFYSARRAVTRSSRGSFSALRIFSINPTPSPDYALLTPLGLSIARFGSRIFRFLTSLPVIMSDYGNDNDEVDK